MIESANDGFGFSGSAEHLLRARDLRWIEAEVLVDGSVLGLGHGEVLQSQF